MSSSKHRGGARGRQSPGDPRRAHASADGPEELDLFTVLTALGSATHADSTPISQEGLYALANALLALAAEEKWAFSGMATLVLHQAISAARAVSNAPMTLVPVDVADPEVLVELGADPSGPTNVADLVTAGLAVPVVPGLVLLSAPGGTGARRGGTRSVTVKLPGSD